MTPGGHRRGQSQRSDSCSEKRSLRFAGVSIFKRRGRKPLAHGESGDSNSASAQLIQLMPCGAPCGKSTKKIYTIDAFLHEGSMPCFATPRPNQHAANLTDVLVRTRSGLLTGSSGISSITDMLGSSLSQASIRCAPIMKNI
jgi:hypothetical protein